MSHFKFVAHSRREFMFIEKFKDIFLNPEGIICQNAQKSHIIPSGLRTIWVLFFYKHIFPSGI
jgi:hypothetical protein